MKSPCGFLLHECVCCWLQWKEPKRVEDFGSITFHQEQLINSLAVIQSPPKCHPHFSLGHKGDFFQRRLVALSLRTTGPLADWQKKKRKRKKKSPALSVSGTSLQTAASHQLCHIFSAAANLLLPSGLWRRARASRPLALNGKNLN